MKIYTKEILLHITGKSIKNPIKESISLKIKSVDEILDIYQNIQSGFCIPTKVFYFETTSYEKIITDFKNYFERLEAAGGIVEKESQILLIKRLEKWDMPKGKIEKGETKTSAAIREVEEECSINVQIRDKVGETWHTYVHKNKNHLKRTHWYAMRCLDDTDMKPQVEEQITDIRWFSPKDVKKALENSYGTIRDIYRKYDQSPKISS